MENLCKTAKMPLVCQEQKTKLRDISLSNDTVTRQIEDLANNLKEQLGQCGGPWKGSLFHRTGWKHGHFQYSANAVFIRQSRRTEIGEELLSLESIKDRTRGVNKMRSRLTDLHAVFRIATTATKSDIIANRKQHHKSHANKKKGMLTYQQIFNVI